jgi:hypothetical protein
MSAIAHVEKSPKSTLGVFQRSEHQRRENNHLGKPQSGNYVKRTGAALSRKTGEAKTTIS